MPLLICIPAQETVVVGAKVAGKDAELIAQSNYGRLREEQRRMWRDDFNCGHAATVSRGICKTTCKDPVDAAIKQALVSAKDHVYDVTVCEGGEFQRLCIYLICLLPRSLPSSHTLFLPPVRWAPRGAAMDTSQDTVSALHPCDLTVP